MPHLLLAINIIRACARKTKKIINNALVRFLLNVPENRTRYQFYTRKMIFTFYYSFTENLALNISWFFELLFLPFWLEMLTFILTSRGPRSPHRNKVAGGFHLLTAEKRFWLFCKRRKKMFFKNCSSEYIWQYEGLNFNNSGIPKGLFLLPTIDMFVGKHAAFC